MDNIEERTYQISASPAPVSLGVDHPELSEEVIAAGLRAVSATAVTEEVVGSGCEGDGVGDGRQGQPGEEAVVEEATLEDEVDEGIEGVPDEQEAVRGPRRAVQRHRRQPVRCRQDRHRRRQRHQRRLVEEVRRQAVQEGRVGLGSGRLLC